MRYLLDTNVVSELMKDEPDPKVLRWVDEHDDETVLSAIVLAEIAFGIEALGDGKRRAALMRELNFLSEDFADRTADFDSAAAWEWARYMTEARAMGFRPPIMDSQIAATARALGLVVVTRNVVDFPLVRCVNPFE